MLSAIWCLFTLLVIAVIIAVVQITKVNKLEEILEIELINRGQIEEIILDSAEIFNSELSEAFKNDDEVGRFFQNLIEIQNKLNAFVEEIKEVDGTESE